MPPDGAMSAKAGKNKSHSIQTDQSIAFIGLTTRQGFMREITHFPDENKSEKPSEQISGGYCHIHYTMLLMAFFEP